MGDLKTVLGKHSMHIPITQRKAVAQPDRVLDDRHGKMVAIQLGVEHSGSAYFDPVKVVRLS